MIGEYKNKGKESSATGTISPVVPGALYRISAWALGTTGRSERAAVVNVTTPESSESNAQLTDNVNRSISVPECNNNACITLHVL